MYPKIENQTPTQQTNNQTVEYSVPKILHRQTEEQVLDMLPAWLQWIQCQSTSLVQTEISIGYWIVIKFGHHRMNPTDSGDILSTCHQRVRVLIILWTISSATRWTGRHSESWDGVSFPHWWSPEFSYSAITRFTFVVLSDTSRKAIGLTAMKFGSRIHITLRMNLNNFATILTCPILYEQTHVYISLSCTLVLISNNEQTNKLNYTGDHGKHFTYWTWACLHWHWERVSMVTLAFSSGQPHRAVLAFRQHSAEQTVKCVGVTSAHGWWELEVCTEERGKT